LSRHEEPPVPHHEVGRGDLCIDFGSLSWVPDVPGIRARQTQVQGRRWAIVEYAAGAHRDDWCLDGHAGFVLTGAIEYEFQDGCSPLSAREGDAFLLVTGRAHRGTNRAHGPTRLFLIDDPAG
jgi:hypothetical protein